MWFVLGRVGTMHRKMKIENFNCDFNMHSVIRAKYYNFEELCVAKYELIKFNMVINLHECFQCIRMGVSYLWLGASVQCVGRAPNASTFLCTHLSGNGSTLPSRISITLLCSMPFVAHFFFSLKQWNLSHSAWPNHSCFSFYRFLYN